MKKKKTEQACKGYSRFVLKGNLPGWMTEQLLSILSQIMSMVEKASLFCVLVLFSSLFFGFCCLQILQDCMKHGLLLSVGSCFCTEDDNFVRIEFCVFAFNKPSHHISIPTKCLLHRAVDAEGEPVCRWT